MAIYTLFENKTLAGLESCTIEIPDELNALEIGDMVNYTAHIKTVAGFPGNTDVAFGLRATAYRDTFYAISYRNSTNQGQRLSQKGYFSVYESGTSIGSFSGQTITMTGTINITQQILAGLIGSLENLELGIFIKYRTSKTSTSFKATAYAIDTTLSISSSGYIMPNLSSMVYVDNGSGNPLGTFGDYVQGKSVPNMKILASNIGIDARFSGSPFRCRLEIINSSGDIPVLIRKNNSFYVGLPYGVMHTENLGAFSAEYAGVVSWTLYIENADGICGITTGNFDVLPYSSPQLLFAVARYSEILDDQGHVSYEESDDGEDVWVNAQVDVSSLNNSNAWTLKLSYTPNDNDGVLPITLISESDGGLFNYPNDPDEPGDRSLINLRFSTANDYTFTAILTDQFNNTEVTTYIYKSDGYFNVEKTGVAVGMRSTGTAEEKKFEVDHEYESHFYGGIAGISNYVTGEVLTGGHWINGEPIYRNVIVGNTTLTNGQVELYSFSNLPSVFIKYNAFIKTPDGNWYPITYTYNANENWTTNIYIESSTGKIWAQAGSSMRKNVDYILILEYVYSNTGDNNE